MTKSDYNFLEVKKIYKEKRNVDNRRVLKDVSANQQLRFHLNQFKNYNQFLFNVLLHNLLIKCWKSAQYSVTVTFTLFLISHLCHFLLTSTSVCLLPPLRSNVRQTTSAWLCSDKSCDPQLEVQIQYTCTAYISSFQRRHWPLMS